MSNGDFRPTLKFEDDLMAYHYDLPENLIAQKPAMPRDSSRLMVLRRATKSWEHRTFKDLPEYLDSNDLIVANNTQVLKARLLGHRIRTEVSPKARKEARKEASKEIIGGKVEFVLLEELQPRVWEGLFHASAKYLPGLCFEIPTPDGRGLRGTLVRGSADSPTGTVVAKFDRDPIESGAGEVPLPHYIHRNPVASGNQPDHKPDHNEDDSDYQTLYAKNLGSAAAPTAGLHFTAHTLAALKERGIGWAEVTLHVGLGTFRPVKETDIRKHKMHEERYEISPEVAQRVTEWKAQGRRVLAVGTTSARTLESAWKKSHLQSGVGRTSLFIRPGAFEIQVMDRMLTNFHLPCSTLLMLISTFAGRDFVLAAYAEAVREKYRFFSYGDAMLIL